MRDIDLICAEEDLPQVRLLCSHMAERGIHLRLHVPPLDIEDLSPVALVIPPRRGRLPALPAGRWVAVYLHECERLENVVRHFPLTDWPARSADRQANALAAWLDRPEHSGEAPRGRSVPDSGLSGRQRLQNVAALVTLVVVVAAVAMLPDTEPGSEPPMRAAPTDGYAQSGWVDDGAHSEPGDAPGWVNSVPVADPVFTVCWRAHADLPGPLLMRDRHACSVCDF